MLEKTTRDAPVVAALQPAMAASAKWFEAAADVLMRGRERRGARRRRTRAAVGHALAFATWRSLAREQGLAQAEAVELMCELVEIP
jgi:hypothetical protein